MYKAVWKAPKINEMAIWVFIFDNVDALDADADFDTPLWNWKRL